MTLTLPHKRLAALTTVLILIVSVTSAQKKEKPSWRTHLSDIGNFSIQFPGNIEETETTIEKGITYKKTATFKDRVFMVSNTIFDIELKNPRDLEEVSLESFNESLGGTITSREPWKVKKHVGLKTSIVLKDQDNALVEYRVMFVNSIQYQVITINPSGAIDPKLSRKFYKSFKPGK